MTITFPLANTQPSPVDDRDYIFDGSSVINNLPARVDLRNPKQELEDQTRLGSCTAHGTVTTCEYDGLKKNTILDLSMLQLYYDTRELENRIGQEGAVLRNAFKTAKNVGVANESSWPYVEENVDVKPPAEVYAEASTQKLLRFEKVVITHDGTVASQTKAINNIKAALTLELPVTIAFRVYNWFMYLKGPLHTHALLNTSVGGYMDYSKGNHALTIVGYDDNLSGGSFIVQNSWGKGWGDNGFGAMSYSQIDSFYEAWVGRGFITPEVTQVADKPFIADNTAVMITALYAALFNKAPDADGLQYWYNRGVGVELWKIADEMYKSQSARDYYGLFLTNEEIVKKLYTNVLGRQVDMASLDWWTKTLDTDYPVRGKVVADMTKTVMEYKGLDFLGKSSKALLRNKIEVGLYCALTLQCRDVTICSVALNGVTKDEASVVTAKQKMRQLMGIV